MKCSMPYVLWGLVIALGCDAREFSKSQATHSIPSTMEDDSLPMLDHPVFVNWSQFPIGTHVVLQRCVSNPQGQLIETRRMWLEDKGPQNVSVGSQVTVQRQGETALVNDEAIVVYPATYRLPHGVDASQFQLPSRLAKETGTEVLNVDGVELNTKIYEWIESNETGPMRVKLWHSDQIPGKIVRQELFTESTSTMSVENVIEWRPPPEDHRKPKNIIENSR